MRRSALLQKVFEKWSINSDRISLRSSFHLMHRLYIYPIPQKSQGLWFTLHKILGWSEFYWPLLSRGNACDLKEVFVPLSFSWQLFMSGDWAHILTLQFWKTQKSRGHLISLVGVDGCNYCKNLIFKFFEFFFARSVVVWGLLRTDHHRFEKRATFLLRLREHVARNGEPREPAAERLDHLGTTTPTGHHFS